MVKVQVKKRGKNFQYTFEIAPQDGKRKWISKSGFKTKPEAERAGLKALNEYLETGHSFKPSDLSYSDYLDYWMQEYCYINLKHRTIETYRYIIKYPFKIIHHELRIKCRFYDLRGSFATINLRNGCEIKDIAEVLGHKRIETTEKYYISSTNEDKKKVTETIEKITNFH